MTTDKRCERCGAYEVRRADGTLVQPHNYGCRESMAHRAAQESPVKRAAAKRTTKRSQ